MVVVKAKIGESNDSIIKQFNKKVLYEGVLADAKKKEFYLKPSLKKKIEAANRRKTAAR